MKPQIVQQKQRLVLLSEVFRSVQGEGSRMGAPSVFVRFSGCNLRCSWKNPDGTQTLCDTPYASYRPERKRHSQAEVCDLIRDLISHEDEIVFTGGEPLLWAESVAAIREVFRARHVTIETNGTQPMTLEHVLYSVSPKLQNSGANSDPDRVVLNLQDLFKQKFASRVRVQLKFVCSMPEDIIEIERFLEKLKQQGLFKEMLVYLMPQGTSPLQLDSRAPWVVAESLRLGVHYSDRLHIRIWGDRRGV